jgi:hypothetical protein
VAAAFVLRSRVDAEGMLERADVDIQDAGGRTLQTLTFRPDCGPEMFRAHSYLADVNFDGYLDLVALKGWGAKWGAYDVRLFEPGQGRFVQSPLTQQLGRLTNLCVDEDRKRIISYTIGPDEPSERVFRVENERLKLEESCRFANDGAPTGIIVRTREGEGVKRTRYSIPLDANGEWTSLPCVENLERLGAIDDAHGSIPWRE